MWTKRASVIEGRAGGSIDRSLSVIGEIRVVGGWAGDGLAGVERTRSVKGLLILSGNVLGHMMNGRGKVMALRRGVIAIGNVLECDLAPVEMFGAREINIRVEEVLHVCGEGSVV